jgi:hypothetical protein
MMSFGVVALDAHTYTSCIQKVFESEHVTEKLQRWEAQLRPVSFKRVFWRKIVRFAQRRHVGIRARGGNLGESCRDFDTATFLLSPAAMGCLRESVEFMMTQTAHKFHKSLQAKRQFFSSSVSQ